MTPEMTPEMTPNAPDVPFEKRHRDGSLWAKGQHRDGREHGYWEFFRLDGTLLRSGHFDAGEQCGTWTTYDKAGMPYKVTQIKPRG
jgi:antitoxin component YwqK of YwqJK toxin-antitoxin module